jgi:hypothetical protein
MNKSSLLRGLRAIRGEWDLVIGALAPDMMQEPGAVGDWSAKDVAAHVTWSERETLGMLRARAVVGSELLRLSEGERNAAVYEQNRERPLPDVLVESERVHRELLAVIEEVSEEDLLQATWFDALPGDWPPCRVVEVNVTEHYRHHLADLRR